MKNKNFFLILFVFLITYYSGNAQITAQINNVKVNGTQISNCGTIAFGANNSVNLSLTLKIIKPSTTNVGDFATFKLYTKYDSNSDPIFIDGIIVPNNAFTQGTSWEAEFSQTTLQASSIASSGSIFYGEYEISENLKYKTCDYALTKPVFTLSSNTNSIPCGSLSPITFTVNNINSSPGTLSYNWVIGTGWNYNGITAPTNLTTSSNTLTLVPTMYPPSNISVIPILSSVAQPQKVATVSLAPFTSTSATINGNISICESSTASVYSITNLPSGLTVTWSSSNTAIATVNSTTGSSTTVNKVSNGTFNLIARVTNSCGQSVSVTKSIGVYTITSLPTPSGSFDLNDFECFRDTATPITFTPDTPFGGIITLTPSVLPHPMRSQTIKITVKYINPCTGEYTSKVITFYYQVPDCRSSKMSDNNFFYTIYPNPSRDIVNIDLKDQNNQPTKGATIFGELFDMVGQSKSKVQISDNKATFSVRGLNKGIYVLNVYINSKVESNQIVVK